jgi:hypothetical protein
LTATRGKKEGKKVIVLKINIEILAQRVYNNGNRIKEGAFTPPCGHLERLLPQAFLAFM